MQYRNILVYQTTNNLGKVHLEISMITESGLLRIERCIIIWYSLIITNISNVVKMPVRQMSIYLPHRWCILQPSLSLMIGQRQLSLTDPITIGTIIDILDI